MDHNDKHVVKMTLEAAQLLCSPYEPGAAPYRRTHYNHPCARWARASRNNYLWLVEYGHALAAEYTLRYGKMHKSARVICWAHDNYEQLDLPDVGLTEFAQAMPDECKRPVAVDAYRTYYVKHKAHIARWTNRPVPAWFANLLKTENEV